MRQILDRRPDNVLNIRQDGFESKAIKALVQSYPDLLSYENGTWPKVQVFEVTGKIPGLLQQLRPANSVCLK